MIQNFEYQDFYYNCHDDDFQFIYYFQKDDYLHSVETTRFYKEFKKMCGYEIAKIATDYIDWTTTKIIYKLELIINNTEYQFKKGDKFHAIEGARLELKHEKDESSAPNIICPICLNDSFTIQYGSYTVYAKCTCGNLMEIYSG